MVDENIIAIAEKVNKLAKKLGAEHSEVVLIQGKQNSINLEESSIVKANSKSQTGIGLRVLVNKAIGLGTSTKFDDSLLEAMVKDAVSLAKVSSPNPDNIGFAEKPSDYPAVEGLYNKELANLSSDKLVDSAIQALNASLEQDSTINVGGNIGLTVASKVIVNSNGVLAESDGSVMTVYINNKITKDNDVGVGFDYGFARTLKEIDSTKIGQTAAEKALGNLGGQKIDSGDYKLLIDKRATRQTIGGILSQGVSAYNIIQGTAFFNDRLAEEIASPNLTIVDNPLEAAGAGSRTFDDEGTPAQKVTIVENGTLLSYLSDVYTSNKLDIPNTGSATKQGYGGIPKPALTQIQIEPGTASKDELFAELGTGIYMESPIFAMAGTNISQQVDVGFWVEKGEIKFPVKNTMMGTTVYDILKNVQMVGKDLLFEGGMKSPMILLGETKFSSGR